MNFLVDPQRDKRVQTILREKNDSSHVVYHTGVPLHLFRHGKKKKVILVATPCYIYLLKLKDMTFYTRWLIRSLKAASSGKILTIGAESLMEEPDNTPLRAVLSTEMSEGREFNSVELEATSAEEVTRIEWCLQKLSTRARLRAYLLAKDEGRTVEDCTQEFKKNGDESSDADSEGSEYEGSSLWGHKRHHHREEEVRQSFLLQRQCEEDSNSLFQKEPSRYLAVASLVDGEFTDYSALKNAYMRGEEDTLLEDLAVFIRENEGQVEKLCERHHPAFLHAAWQCFSISEQDAELVGQELGGATALARSSVVEMKRVAADLNLSRCIKENVTQVCSLLRGSMEVAKHLETVETKVRKGQLIGAVVMLKQLVRMATTLAEYAIGEYVIHHRAPNLVQDIFTAAVQHFNGWLKLLRELSHPVGSAALSWEGAVQSGHLEKKLQVTEDGDWWVEITCVNAHIKRAPFVEAAGISKIIHGASLQEVFEGLHCGTFYRSYYSESRARQAKLDLYEVPFTTEGIDGKGLVMELEHYLTVTLGFVLIEDITHHATEPHVQSTAEILCMWEQLSNTVAERARRVATLLTSDCNYTERMIDVFRLLRRFVNIAVGTVSSVQLDPLLLTRVVEIMSDNIISTWLQEACSETAQAVLIDALDPLSVENPQEYEAYVTRFSLDRCRAVELPPPVRGPTSGCMVLPYARLVPTTGNTVLQFLARCHSIMVMDHGAVTRHSELNNVDEMLLKYLSVVFRTVAELLQGHLAAVSDQAVVQLSVYVTSCAALSVVVSCVEQQFVLTWPRDYGRKREKLGEPRLLASSAALFAKAVQKGIERLLSALIAEVDIHLKPMTDINYWRRFVDIRKNASLELLGMSSRSEEAEMTGGFEDAMEYVIAMTPKLTVVLQRTVVCSVLGTVITYTAMTAQAHLEQVIHGGCGDGDVNDFAFLRDCLREFELLCVTQIPIWKKDVEGIVSGFSFMDHFPLNPKQIADEHLLWIARKEASIAAEKGGINQFITGIEDAGKKMVNTVSKGLQVFGQSKRTGSNVIPEEYES